MGEGRDDDQGPIDVDVVWREARAEWAARIEQYERMGLSELAEELRRGGPPPVPLRGAPLIVDTDVGGDPDDAIALAAARGVRELALVITTNEHDGRRARLARHLLDLLGRGDVPVVAGADLGNARHLAFDGLVPDDVAAQPAAVVDAVVELCERTAGPVRWLGIGPLSNLAGVLEARPGLAERLVVSQMGGAIDYRDPSRAEHNFRLDPAAARTALQASSRIELVISDVTFTPEIEITADHPIYQRLCAPDAPAWASLLRRHMDQWFEAFHPGSMQHDPLTLTTALELPLIHFGPDTITIQPDGRMHRDPDGTPVRLSRRADYPAFNRWLTTRLTHHNTHRR